MKHKHHIIPRYAGGSDDPSNLVELSPIQHAMWHYAEWRRKGEDQDRLAWQGLVGLISPSEARMTAIRIGSLKARQNKERNNPDWHKKLREAATKRHEWLRNNDAQWRERERQHLTNLAKIHGHKGGEAGRGKNWWFNELTGETTRSFNKPGPDWKRGRASVSDTTKNKHRTASLNNVFWNNSTISIRARECPGEGWFRGRLPHKKK